MIIKDNLIKPYEIHIDGNSYTVGKVKENSKGEPVFHAEKYYINLSSAIGFIVRSNILDQHQELTIKEYIQSFQEGIDRFKSLIQI